MAALRPVTLNVYDVAPPPSSSQQQQQQQQQQPSPLPTDQAPPLPLLVRINGLGRAAGLGGVFHGGIAVDNKEYAFGFCERGTGVYATRPKSNPLYTFRESLELGSTRLAPEEVAAIVRRLKEEWQGSSYDLLRRNCCHFCNELARELGVEQPPAWLNRLANAGDVTATAAAEGMRVARSVAAEAGRLGWQGLEAIKRAAAGAGLGGSGGGGEAPQGPTGSALLRSLAANDGGLFWGSRGQGGGGGAGGGSAGGPAAGGGGDGL
jgi:hypothetical protein